MTHFLQQNQTFLKLSFNYDEEDNDTISKGSSGL